MERETGIEPATSSLGKLTFTNGGLWTCHQHPRVSRPQPQKPRKGFLNLCPAL
ncbi:MAG: hypothetical protein JWN34_198 [Bryobacterales bacterium]|nr:hypothetical protein [Bryobacterales bacterium]